MQKNSPVFAFPGFSPKIFLANYRTIPYNNACIMCRCDGIGRRDGLKIRWWRHRVGSSPTTGTTSEQSPLCSDVLLFLRNKRTSSARSLAPPFQITTASLGCDLVLGANRKLAPRKCSHFPNQNNPNSFPIGDGFGLFIVFDRYESAYFHNGVRRKPTSKPRDPRKKKAAP